MEIICAPANFVIEDPCPLGLAEIVILARMIVVLMHTMPDPRAGGTDLSDGRYAHSAVLRDGRAPRAVAGSSFGV